MMNLQEIDLSSASNHRLLLSDSMDGLSLDDSMDVGVPLLPYTDQGSNTDIASTKDGDEQNEKLQAFAFLSQFSARLGCALGYSAPFVIIGTALLIAVACSRFEALGLTTNQIRGLIVIITLVASQAVYFFITPSYVGTDERTLGTLELVKFRFSLGALTGALGCWVTTCLIFGFGVWDIIGLITGSLVVLHYHRKNEALHEEQVLQIMNEMQDKDLLIV